MLTSSLVKKAARVLELAPFFSSLEGDSAEWLEVAEEWDSCINQLIYTPSVCISELFAKQDVWEAYRNYAIAEDDLLLSSILNDREALGLNEKAHCVAH